METKIYLTQTMKKLIKIFSLLFCFLLFLNYTYAQSDPYVIKRLWQNNLHATSSMFSYQ
jgi:hypothetical protein